MNYKVGDIIDEYKLLSECGRGAFGTVFFAENQLTAKRVAFKIIYKHGTSAERELKGLRQYQIIAGNTNLLQIYQVKEYDDFFYYTMDIADNLSDDVSSYMPDTLANRLHNNILDADTVREIHRDLLENLQTLHGKGLFHRDIKPDNILFINNRARLGDIGLVTDTSITTLRGTPGFMPTEVLAGIRNYEASDDYYALGKVIYCALTGEPAGNYPSFPADCAIADKIDLIKLYNKYCSCKHGSSAGKRNLGRVLPYAAFLLLVIIAAAILWIRQVRGTNSALAGTAALEFTVEDPQFAQLQVILREYIPNPVMAQFYLQLQTIYEEKILAKCNRDLPLSKEEKLLADYFANENALLELFDGIKLAINTQGIFSQENIRKLTQLQLHRLELEEKLEKNIKKIILL